MSTKKGMEKQDDKIFIVFYIYMTKYDYLT